jgi:hypothetical protein
MTAENKQSIAPEDIIAVEYICRACRTAIRYPRDKWHVLPKECPFCERLRPKEYKPWFPVEGTSDSETSIEGLLRSLAALSKGSQRQQFDLRFEIAAAMIKE